MTCLPFFAPDAVVAPETVPDCRRASRRAVHRTIMRVLLIALFLLPLAPTAGHASPAADSLRALWQDGTEAYRQGRYAQAAESYAAVARAGVESGPLFYNLGNAYFRVGETGQAIRYYEKARRLLPSDPRIAHNLDMARSRAEAPVRSVAQGGVIRLVRAWPAEMLFLLGALLWAGGLIGWAWLRRSATSDDASPPATAPQTEAPASGSPWMRPLATSLAAGGILLAGLAVGIDYLQTIDRRAVVLVDRAPMHAAPTAAGTPIAQTDTTVVSAGVDAPPDTSLVEGTVVLLRSERNGWTRIEAPGGRTGWIPTPALGEI
jgi:hypothetical protein